MNRVGKLNTTLSMNRVGKLNTTLSMNRVVGWELSFTEDFVVIPTIDLEIQLFVGKVMVESILLGSSLQLLSCGFYRTYLKLHFVVNI